MKRFPLIFVALLVAGCGVNWRPADNSPNPPAGGSELAGTAKACEQDKASRMAQAHRTIAAKVEAGEFKDYSDLRDFEKKLLEDTKQAYQPLADLRTKRLTKDAEGYFDLQPADAAIWREIADGLEQVAKGK